MSSRGAWILLRRVEVWVGACIDFVVILASGGRGDGVSVIFLGLGD